MPITRRRRANPPDQPENTTNHVADQTEATVPSESPATEQGAETPATPPEATRASGEGEQGAGSSPYAATPVPPATPGFPASARSENMPYQQALPAPAPSSAGINGDRVEPRGERQDYTPSIEPGRRTSRGELFRRPPQIPTPAPMPMPTVASAPLQAPTHEISLPLGNLLHLAYNPSYTGADEARSVLLHKLAHDSKAGGRGRCWSCGSLAIVYDHWNTRSKNFGEVGIAFCEICGVWSVM
jgi:hypothetical protein